MRCSHSISSSQELATWDDPTTDSPSDEGVIACAKVDRLPDEWQLRLRCGLPEVELVCFIVMGSVCVAVNVWFVFVSLMG